MIFQVSGYTTIAGREDVGFGRGKVPSLHVCYSRHLADLETQGF